MKTKNRGGRPRHNDEAKIAKSVTLDPFCIRAIEDEFKNVPLSTALDIIIKDWINRRTELCKEGA